MSGIQEAFSIEYSKSDRSTCKNCGSGLSKGELRVGHGKPGQYHDGLEYSYFHVKCKIKSVKILSDLKGWETLRWDDQMTIRTKHFPNDTSANAALDTQRKEYINALWKIQDQLSDSVLKGPQIKSIIEENKGRVEKVPGDVLVGILSDWLLLGRTGSCPTCKNFHVGFNSVEYKCYGYVTGFTKCDWKGTTIKRHKIVIPSSLKANQLKFIENFKFSKDYPKDVCNYDGDDDDEEEDEEEKEESSDSEAEESEPESVDSDVVQSDPESGDEQVSKTKKTKKKDQEDAVPIGSELYGMVFIIAGNQKNLDPSPSELKSLINDHGGSVVETVAKANIMISCDDEVKKSKPTKKVSDAIDSIPIFPTSWLQDLVDRKNEGIELRKSSISSKYVIEPSECQDDYELVTTKYVAPKKATTSTTSTKSSSTLLKKRKEPEKKEIIFKKKPKMGSDILKPDDEISSIYNIYMEDDQTYGTITYNVMLNLVDIHSGYNKFYKIQLLNNNNTYIVFLKWGRIGKTMGSKQELFTSKKGAKELFSSKFEYFTGITWGDHHSFEKKPGKYYMVSLDDGWDDDNDELESAIKKNKSSDNSQKMLASLSTPSNLAPRTIELIKLMFDQEMMKKQLASMKVDIDKMPLGKISKKQIMDGYQVLAEIQEILSRPNGNTSTAPLSDCANRFYSLIPHNFGSNLPPIINTNEMLKEKMDLIEAFIDIEIANKLKKQSENTEGNLIDNHYKSLKTNLAPLDKDSELYKTLVSYAHKSHDTSYFDFGLKVEDIFEVEREGEVSRFDPWKKNDNKMLLWHGSRLTNWCGIISQGLRIAPPEAPKTGYRFGKGVYFADCISKSASYCFTSKQSPTALMILCEVALGKMNELKHDKYMEKAPSGTHSTKALGMSIPNPKEYVKVDNDIVVPAGSIIKTGTNTSCSHNEFIVYDVSQIRIKYILKVNVQNKY
ncbi:poly(ADP-ribosyl)transferase [Cavenderia fasciculata]|uniref:Poly [ADP-ribose] polymerase n=1 Tax=Cavenderia fasciculata TaxID=261658 RepID=F4Q0P0_CACFS|nr:poly(ADP-ribosyl)transferase [Cavenderia fasciculata]EGG18391.1 poly(ADP-ribosyl)transferase [Cavenderia fasciculata]|eukprot:XP_004366295.1 poly(ADP-ribosyl)transferase [Cavenderia fasciculata]